MFEQGEDKDLFFLSAFEMPDFMWDDINQNDFCLSPTVGDKTPAKDCGEYFFDGSRTREKPSRHLEGDIETSQAKRRRQLFTSDDENSTINGNGKEQITSSSENSWGEAAPSNYFNQSHAVDSLDMNHFVSCDHIDVNGSRYAQDRGQCIHEAAQQIPLLSSCRIFKGKKSSMINPMKLTASIAYPFSHIKPCGGHGEMTLKDINQLIHSPPSSNSNGEMDDPHIDYSPISGKPVLVKTKIQTKGGKGSITILRTKG